MSSMIRTFSELNRLDTLEERFEYLSLRGDVASTTFGFDRYLNQGFYTSRQWKLIRQKVIARDNGCLLALPDHEIYDRIIIHHMNPMSKDQLIEGDDDVLDPEFLISTTHRVHNAIHYGDARQLPQPYVERRPGDTTLWGRR